MGGMRRCVNHGQIFLCEFRLKKKKKESILFRLHRAVIAACGLFLVVASRGFFSLRYAAFLLR